MHNENKVPLIRLAKRDMMEPWKVWCIRLASIVLALLLGGLVMMIALPDGATPIDGYATIITGALGKKTAITGVVRSPFSIDPEKCVKCYTCIEACPFDAIKEVELDV